MPFIGAPCSFRHPRLQGVRRLPITGFENWLVFYLAQEDRVEIIRVLHGARNIAAIFQEGERGL